MKRRFQHLFLIIFLAIISLCITNELPSARVQAATSKDIAGTYLNTVYKNLYVGIKGKSKFDFNIKKAMQKEGSTYFWYVVQDKGDSFAVTIDSETGLVNARLAGTAYIRCKITLADGTVVQPEATVTVINSITGVEISNIPDDGKVAVGYPTDFDYKITKTAGTNLYTKSIVRFEIADDTAGVGTVSDDGVVVPQQVGSFNIRAVCFQSVDDYNAWLKNKEGKADKVTAVSEWTTVTTKAVAAVAATEEKLKELLANNNIIQITLLPDKGKNITIPGGYYPDKTLIVSASDSTITNYGVFKLIKIENSDNSTWKEHAIDNSIEVYGCKIDINVFDEAKVKNINFNSSQEIPSSDNPIRSCPVNDKSKLTDSSGSLITLSNTSYVTTNGKVTSIVVAAPTNLVLEGGGSIDKLTVDEPADGTMIVSYVVSELSCNADSIMTLYGGKDLINVHLAKDTSTIIENLSGRPVTVFYENGFFEAWMGYAVKVVKGVYSLIGHIDTIGVIKINPTYTNPVTATSLKAGDVLGSSALSGNFYNGSAEVAGNLSWVLPATIVTQSGTYQWVFVPNDTGSYNVIYGTVNVNFTN